MKFWNYWPIALALIVLFLLPALFLTSQPNFYGHELNRPAKNFTLLTTQQQSHSLTQHQGRYTFLYFGYLNCDEVCHNQVGVMFNLSQQAQLNNLDFIFISMDPNRDNPELLDRYFNALGPNFYALYDTNMQTIQALAQAYHAPFFKEPNSGLVANSSEDYEITHPGFLYLIDPAGIIRLMYPNMHLRYDLILQDLQKIENLNLYPTTGKL